MQLNINNCINKLTQTIRIVLFPIIFLAPSISALSQAPPIQWQQNNDGIGGGITYSVFETNDNGYIVCGYTFSPGSNNITQDAWVVKMNACGIIEWQKTYGGSSYENALCIRQTSDGGYIFAGNTWSNDGDVTNNHGIADAWIVKLNSSGNIQWQKTYGGSRIEEVFSIEQTSDGGYILAGETQSFDGDITFFQGGSDYWVLKLDNSGNLQWQKTYGGSRPDVGISVKQTNDGGYIIGGSIYSTDGDVTGNHGPEYDCWVIKITSSGSIQWERSLGGYSIESLSAIRQTNDGGYIICAEAASNDGDLTFNNGASDYWVVKLNSSGNIQWQRTYGGSDFDYPFDIYQTSDGGYIVGGATASNDGDVSGLHAPGNGVGDFWVVKLDATGNIVWQKVLGGSLDERLFSLIQTKDGGYVMTGSASSNDGDVSGNPGGSPIWSWTIKLNWGAALTIDKEPQSITVCSGQNTNFSIQSSNYTSLQWQVNSGSGWTDITNNGSYSGANADTLSITNFTRMFNGNQYRCIVKSMCDSLISITSTLNVQPTPAAFLPPDTTICSDSSLLVLAPSGYSNYLWNNGSVSSSLTINKAGDYWLQVTDNNGCKGKDSISVLEKICLKGFYVPSAFTPNGDGKNDFFRPLLFGSVKKYQFTIYNRWGQVVFNTNEIGKGWDGKLSSVDQGTFVFVWLCEYQLEGDELKIERGTVTLIR